MATNKEHSNIYIFAKSSVLGQKLKRDRKKDAKKDSTTTLELFCGKNCSKNTFYFKNEGILKKWPKLATTQRL